MFIELIEIASKHQDLELKPLVRIMMKYFGCDSDEDKNNFLRILLCYEKQEDICKESSVDQVTITILPFISRHVTSLFICLFTLKALFVFDLKPIAVSIGSKLIEHEDKHTIKCFNGLNANELEHLCTNSVGSHFVQEVLRLFNTQKRTENLAQIYEKLKV